MVKMIAKSLYFVFWRKNRRSTLKLDTKSCDAEFITIGPQSVHAGQIGLAVTLIKESRLKYCICSNFMDTSATNKLMVALKDSDLP